MHLVLRRMHVLAEMDRFRRSLKGPDTRSHSAKWSHDLYSCSDHLAFTTIMFRSMQQQLRLAPPAPVRHRCSRYCA